MSNLERAIRAAWLPEQEIEVAGELVRMHKPTVHDVRSVVFRLRGNHPEAVAFAARDTDAEFDSLSPSEQSATLERKSEYERDMMISLTRLCMMDPSELSDEAIVAATENDPNLVDVILDLSGIDRLTPLSEEEDAEEATRPFASPEPTA